MSVVLCETCVVTPQMLLRREHHTMQVESLQMDMKVMETEDAFNDVLQTTWQPRGLERFFMAPRKLCVRRLWRYSTCSTPQRMIITAFAPSLHSGTKFITRSVLWRKVATIRLPVPAQAAVRSVLHRVTHQLTACPGANHDGCSSAVTELPGGTAGGKTTAPMWSSSRPARIRCRSPSHPGGTGLRPSHARYACLLLPARTNRASYSTLLHQVGTIRKEVSTQELTSSVLTWADFGSSRFRLLPFSEFAVF